MHVKMGTFNQRQLAGGGPLNFDHKAFLVFFAMYIFCILSKLDSLYSAFLLRSTPAGFKEISQKTFWITSMKLSDVSLNREAP